MSALGIGILIGGRGARMGGVAKGLLRSPEGPTLVERLLEQCRQAAPFASVYLLGNRLEYDALHLPRLQDDPSDVGPLGGLHALLQQPHEQVLLLGCDLPFLTAAVIGKLVSTSSHSVALAAQSGEPPRWEPMLSRFRVRDTLPIVRAQLAAEQYGLSALLHLLSATHLPLTDDELRQLTDWDAPHEVTGGQ